MESLCRCGVLIDDRVADMQLHYLQRLLKAEFSEFLVAEPQVVVRVGKPGEVQLHGEPAQGLMDTSPLSCGEYAIVVSPILRREQALLVIAHELGHAWQFSVRSDAANVEPQLLEGFAEWVAFHLVRRAGLTELSSEIRQGRDPVYGVGFRWFFRVEKEHGVGAVVSIMLNWLDRAGHRSAP